MAAPTAGALAAASWAAARPAARRARVGVLPDGTPYFGPVGEVVVDADFVLCHLCGQWRRSVTAHLRGHGWTKDAYCDAFGLERGQSLEGDSTRKMRSVSFSARLIFEPAVRSGSARGRARARAGDLARDAAAAARGRPLPEQRRRKASAAMAGMAGNASAEANRARHYARLVVIAARAAAENGYSDIGTLVQDRLAGGASLAAISREAGLHKDWLSRHLDALDPAAAAAVRAQSAKFRAEARWLAVVGPLGFAEAGVYLRDRHLERHRTVNEIAAETGMSYHAVAAALRRHGLPKIAHAGKRYAADRRAAQVAAAVGYSCVADYVADRRADGWTWSAMAAETGQPQTWLRRQFPGGQSGKCRERDSNPHALSGKCF